MADRPEQKWLPRTPYLDVPEAGCCQVCGMEDGYRFKLGVGTATWNGYPVHDACEQWITTNPDGSKAELKTSPPAKAPSGAFKTRMVTPSPPPLPPPDPEPAPHDVYLRFPHVTASEIYEATMSQTGGHPILVTWAEPGDVKLLMYRLPDIPKYLTLDSETVHVAGGGPLDGGFTLIMLTKPLTARHQSGTTATASSEPPHPAQCTCAACVSDNIDRLDKLWSTG